MNKLKEILTAVGPGFIIASVVLGPGSITVSSQIGATQGYSLLWVIVLSGIAMGMYVYMASRVGVTQNKTILQTIADQYGRWFAALIGISSFVMATSFQFGNNLGVATALHSLTGISENIWPLFFTGAAIVLVFFAKGLYRILEKLMMVLVMTMIIAFLLNLIFTKPDLIETAKGFIPSRPRGGMEELAALVATTFVLHVAIYQAYLSQDKGWQITDMKRGFRDMVAGIIMLAGITSMILMTSAAALHPKGIAISSAADMAIQLEALFGSYAKIIFSIGLWAAAFSSLTVNAVVGGGLLSDGLGLGRSMEGKAPRAFAILAMLIGMSIAVFFRGNIVHALVVAQASTLFAVPAVAIGLFLIANNKKVMRQYTNSWKQNVIAVFGLVLIFLMVYFKYHQLIVKISEL
ncbi:Nramp family divalent metal transporter [candidate division KSB1 bacterium]|nr:Nramp family divalent metal transporter [candidate division KSB1 bacterium]RQW02724.1 MAG: divalent metal cation transporter [candidate division KSB1 bacterium]